MITGSYTFSKLLSNADEVFAVGVGTAAAFSALPFVLGGDQFEKGLSQNDRTHRGVFSYVYEIPFMKEQRGFVGRLLGGFQISGVTSFESGTPYSVFKGFDSDGIGGGNERPSYNPAGQAGVRAVPVVNATGAITGYINPDNNNSPIDPATARYIVNPTYNPALNSIPRFGSTPRGSERSDGINNWNVNIQKNTRIGETTRIEARAEFFNFFNHPQFNGISTSNAGTGIARRFLNPDAPGTSGGGRVVRYQMKFVF